ncbi:hypothetical protein MMC27_003440 [Xylographa pallens]|nr:hypothetical protein [Xylographa pallens]
MRGRVRAAPVPVIEVKQTEDLTDDVNLSRHVPSSESGDDEDQASNPLSISEERQDSSMNNDEQEVFMQFGPDASYFIRSSQGPVATTKAWEELDIHTPYIMALASNGGWFAAYESITGGLASWKLSLNDVQKQKIQVWQHKDDQWIYENTSYDAYQMLAEWLRKNFENNTTVFRKCNLTFGPEQKILQQMKQGGLGPLKTVSLGAGGTWVTTWDVENYSWALGNRYYDDVHEALKSNNKDRSGGINYIAISPYEDAYFMYFNNGVINYHSPVDNQACKDFMHFIFRYLQERARADKVTYRLLVGKDKAPVAISPTTSYESMMVS